MKTPRSSRVCDIYRVHACPSHARVRRSVGWLARSWSKRREKRITVLLCSRGMTRTKCSNFAQYRRNTGRFGNADQHFPSRPLFLSLTLSFSWSLSVSQSLAEHRLDIFSTVFSFRNVTHCNNPSRILSSCPHVAQISTSAVRIPRDAWIKITWKEWFGWSI